MLLQQQEQARQEFRLKTQNLLHFTREVTPPKQPKRKVEENRERERGKGNGGKKRGKKGSNMQLTIVIWHTIKAFYRSSIIDILF